MNEFTLALVGSINTFILHRYFLRRMLLVVTPLTGTASTNITACRMSSILLILSPFFDDNGGAGPTHKILSSCDLCPPHGLLDMVADPSRRRLRGQLPNYYSPRSLMTMAALVRHIRFYRAAIYVLPKDCWIWWQILVAEDSVDNYPTTTTTEKKERKISRTFFMI